ncbi:NBS-LRR type disease resistance protein [Quillaja saponaria]|uniref:NBS-LRR type disease resistance protein n=1 Tax=Quillaja saponaria TaxID=32244 RepID=A0AAD7QAM5_QUISA|nr:NBS-LRR type disease resistance protein [Quillaja saponaria]
MMLIVYFCGIFSFVKVIPKLEELALSGDQVEIVKHRSSRRGLFPNLKLLTLLSISKPASLYCPWFLEQKPNLEELALQSCSCEEILFFEVIDNKESDTVRIECPKKLALNGISEIEYIFKKGSWSQLVQIQNLQHLNVLKCYSLIGLAQGLVSLNHLKYLEICECYNLKSLVTSSTAKSFVQLTSLKISSCRLITNIVADEDEAVCDREITFSKLELLELNLLPGLESFCLRNHALIFPLLKSMFVIQCPKMKTFTPGNSISTPQLRRVDVHKIEDAWFWEGDLNATIHKVFTDMVAFHGIEDLLLSEYPMLKGVWSNRQGPLKLSKLKQLQVWNCEFISSVIFSPTLLQSLNNLEGIRVYNCDSAVQVFDLEGLGIDGHLGLLPCLKELQLGRLPNLTHIWSKEPHGILDLKNLISLTISECHSLRNLFTSSMVSGLMGLQEMEIKQCNGIEEIITKASSPDEAAASIGSKITFPRLNVIVLKYLPNLTCFYSGSETLECPSLKRICKENCPQMKAFDMIEASNTSIGNISNSKIAFPKVEVLQLGLNDWSLHLPEASRSNIKLLTMNSGLPYSWPRRDPFWRGRNIPLGLIWRFRNLEQLHLEEIYNVEELNLCEEDGSNGKEEVARDVVSKLKKLNLFKLSNLRTSFLSLAASFENLTVLVVSQCNALMSVVNSAVAATLVQLTYLRVEDCCKMTEIISSDQGGEANKEKEIVFHQLQILVLRGLRSLGRFSSGNHTIRFPILEMVLVENCPEMESFSCGLVETPQLKRVQLERYEEDYFNYPNQWEKKQWVTYIQYLLIDQNRKVGEDKWFWVDNHTNAKYLCQGEVIANGGGDIEDEFVFTHLEMLILYNLPALTRFCSRNYTIRLPNLEKVVVCECPVMKIFSSGVVISKREKKHEGEEHEEGKGSEEKPEKKASTQTLEEKVNLFCRQHQSQGTEYDSKETPDATLSKKTREPKSNCHSPNCW